MEKFATNKKIALKPDTKSDEFNKRKEVQKQYTQVFNYFKIK